MTRGVHFRVVIPARYASTRLPGKPLLELAGKPMIQHVIERSLQSGASETIVATDDDRVIDAVEHSGAIAVKTRSDHVSGSDRIVEVVETLGLGSRDLVVNVQGDEPLIPPSVIDQVASLIPDDQDTGVATLYEPIRSAEDVFDPNIVKVVVSNTNFALYFSRAPIPWERESFGRETRGEIGQTWKRHIGIYAYRCGALRQFVAMSPSELEQTEALEQLRFLQNGIPIRIAQAMCDVPGGVDTPEDADRIMQLLRDQSA